MKAMIVQQDWSRPKGLMVFQLVATTSMRFVQSGAKINVDYYIDHFCPVTFIACFPIDEEKKMIYHHDSASSKGEKARLQYSRV